MTFDLPISQLLLSLLWAASACSAEKTSGFKTKTHSIPSTCFSSVSGALASPSCYTETVYTHRVGGCPNFECPPRTQPIACPALARVEFVDIPCKTNCCPTTKTITSTTSCPVPCPTTCVIPTETITRLASCTSTPKESKSHHTKSHHTESQSEGAHDGGYPKPTFTFTGTHHWEPHPTGSFTGSHHWEPHHTGSFSKPSFTGSHHEPHHTMSDD